MSSFLNVVIPLLVVAVFFIPTLIFSKKRANGKVPTKTFQDEEAEKALIRMQQQNNQEFYERHNKT